MDRERKGLRGGIATTFEAILYWFQLLGQLAQLSSAKISSDSQQFHPYRQMPGIELAPYEPEKNPLDQAKDPTG